MLSEDSDSEQESTHPPSKLLKIDPAADRKDVFKTSNNKSLGEKTKSKQNFAMGYLLKHGHKEGRGLGKLQDGIVEPVEASVQKGTRGLGFKAVDLEDTVSKYDPALENISIAEEIEWLENDYKEGLSESLLKSWMKFGPQLKLASSDSQLCDPAVISDILKSKSALDAVTSKELLSGKSRSNPFESISNGIFLNRAAMKMANMDAILNQMFTEPKTVDGNPMVGPEDLLYFADVCAGPGGFSEYVLFRKKWRAKGFGFTLKNENDFVLEKFFAGPSETFEPHYGERGDGDVYVPENIISFKQYVLRNTDNLGVHFMMADGGINYEGHENEQELLSKKLYLCQCLVALLIVRNGGHFVCKLFDLWTPFSAGLVYLMYRSFHTISIIKPNSSRPASSERYLVCKHKREDSTSIANHLFNLNKLVPQYSEESKQDVLEIVPMEILTEGKFYRYFRSSNNRIGKNQIYNLIKLAAFCENTDLMEARPDLRIESLKRWNIPDKARVEPKKYDTRTLCVKLLGSSPFQILQDIGKNPVSSFQSFKENVRYINDWHYVIVNGERSTCTFYLGLGRNNVHKYKSSKGWTKWNDNLNVFGLCLPAETLVYGELVPELRGEGRSQAKRFAFHIIDGLFLAGQDIRTYPLQKRWKMCKMFAKSLCKESFPVRMKNHDSLRNINSLPEKLVLKCQKSSSFQSSFVPVGDYFWKAGGLIFFKDTKGSWHRFFSSNAEDFFLDNCKTREKMFERDNLTDAKQNEIYADFEESFRNRVIWICDSEVLTKPCNDNSKDSDLSTVDFQKISKYVSGFYKPKST